MCLTILWNCQKLLRVEVVPAKEKTRKERSLRARRPRWSACSEVGSPGPSYKVPASFTGKKIESVLLHHPAGFLITRMRPGSPTVPLPPSRSDQHQLGKFKAKVRGSPSSRKQQALIVSQEKQHSGVRDQKTPFIQSVKWHIHTDSSILIILNRQGLLLLHNPGWTGRS